MNHLPGPSMASSSPGITNMEGTTRWLTAFSYGEGSRSSAPGMAPAAPISFLAYADAGQAITCTLWALRKARTGEGWTRFQGHRQCGFWLCT